MSCSSTMFSTALSNIFNIAISCIGLVDQDQTKLYNKNYLQRDLTPHNAAITDTDFPSGKLRTSYGYDCSIGSLRGYSNITDENYTAYSFTRQNIRLGNAKDILN
ncbi:hypothetical protein ACTJKN_09195 [Pedobacter sp. 22163]|uniref:hypothetical protein n=1 Tax=Pedobacter sp. 22163 TaxID=3453883 RepID=UPI003F867B02